MKRFLGALSLTLMLVSGVGAEEDLATKQAGFACDLYLRAASKPGNLFFSPWSVSTALAMTSAGARGTTAEEMLKTLHYSDDSVHSALGAQIKDLEKPTSGYQLSVANRIWPNAGLSLQPSFETLLRTSYGATVQALNFDESARQVINQWVATQTQDKIQDLLPSGAVSSATQMVLTNAIYFKGTWKVAFDPKNTSTRSEFHVRSGPPVVTPMMCLTDSFRHATVGDVEILELPYTGERLSMILLLPTEADGLPALEAKLSAVQLEKWLAPLESSKMRCSIPRFRLTWEASLSAILQSLGMRKAFGAGADFSGMGGTPGAIFLSEVFHKAFVEVNEAGTEAAAATAVLMTRSMASPDQFIADHPFLFLIRDSQNGTILFMGRLEDPTK